MSTPPIAPTDPLLALAKAVVDLSDALPALKDACTDPDGADVAELLLDVREAQAALGKVETELTQAVAFALNGDSLDTPTLHVERRRARDRKEWQHTDWQRDVRQKVIQAKGLKGAVVIDANGVELESAAIVDALAEVQKVHGAMPPKTTALRFLGLSADDYCSTTPGRVTIAVQRVVETTVVPDGE